MKYVTLRLIFSLVLLCQVAPGLKAQTFLNEVIDEWPDSRYVDHGDGTVSDPLTRLMWSKCLVGLSEAGCGTGLEAASAWDAAVESASASNHAGCVDWRLPNLKELETLIAFNRYRPIINEIIFPNTDVVGVWTSSPRMATEQAWFINFRKGTTGSAAVTELKSYRLVRDDNGPCT